MSHPLKPSLELADAAITAESAGAAAGTFAKALQSVFSGNAENTLDS